MTASSPQSQPLHPHTAGANLYLDEAAVNRVQCATGLQLRSNVNFNAFSTQLNQLVQFTMLRRLSLPLSREKVDQLRNAFENYESISKEFQKSKYFPPLMPIDWRLMTLKWFSEMNELFKKRSKGGRNKNFIVEYLYPRAIALYKVGFGVDPVSTTSENDTLLDGPTARFLNAVFEEVENSIQSFGFDGVYTVDEVAKLGRFKTTPAALRKNINKAMRLLEMEPDETLCKLQGISLEEAAKRPKRPVWKIYSDMFETLIINS